jgi:inorganic pyrophosphatase
MERPDAALRTVMRRGALRESVPSRRAPVNNQRMTLKVFIQNEAGISRKHYHDEKTLELQRVVDVSQPYPFPYGFILETTADDGWNVDCYVITGQRLTTGQIVECEPIGLMQQWEDDAEDHNVLAVLAGERVTIDQAVEERLAAFSRGVFAHIQNKRMVVGRFLGASDAEAHVAAHRDPGGEPAP